MAEITWEDFDKVEIRVGRIVAVEPFPRARKPSYKLTIDFGEFGVKRSSAQLTHFYTPEDLLNRQVLAVTNFPPRNIAGFMSEVLTLGLPGEGTEREGHVVLIQPEREVELGARLF